MKYSEKKFPFSRQSFGQWNHFHRKEEETIRDENGFIMLENPHEYGKISDLWKKREGGKKAKKEGKKRDSSHSQKTTTVSGEQTQNHCKVKFFQTFDQMTQHMKEKKPKKSESEASGKEKKKTKRRSKKNSQESEKRRSSQSRKRKREKEKTDKKGEKSSVSVSESKKKKGRRSAKPRKESTSNKNLLKQNLEDHHVKKIGFLTEQLDQQSKFFRDYSKRVREVLRTQILQNEEHEKEKKRRFLRMAKERLGEFVLRGGMAKTKEVWVDGGLMKDVKDRLQRVRREKEIREKFRKTLKRRKTSTVTAEEINSGELLNPKDHKASQTPGNSRTSFPGSLGFLGENVGVETGEGPSLLFNPHLSPQPNMLATFDRSTQGTSQINKYEFTFDEAKDLVNMQITFLNKEESDLKEKLDVLEAEKKEYLKVLRQVYDEENCRFGNRFKPSGGKEGLWDGEHRSTSKLLVPKLSLPGSQDAASLQNYSWPLLNERYQLISLLGKGGFSEVYKAYDLKRMRYVACKIHQLNPHWSLTSRSNYIRHALRENQVHRFLKHLNIVEHFDSVEIDSNSFCTILEFCNGPSLSTYLKTHKTLNEKEAKMIVRQILSGLLFLNQKHDAKIIHYDLKPQNILFSNGIPKISDFGLCKVMNNDDTKLELTSQGVGTYYYLPPECFIRDRDNPILISTKVDIWSLGVIFFEMLYGFRPFGHNLSQERIFKDGIMLRAHSVTFPNRPNVSEETKEFIRKALSYHQEERMDVVEAHTILNSK